MKKTTSKTRKHKPLPQTARGRKMMKMDFAVMDRQGKIEHKQIS